MTDDDLLVFDEDEAVKYIYENLPKEFKNKISRDDIDYVMDIMYDFYEKTGLMDDDAIEEADVDEEELFDYIFKCIQEDKLCKLTKEELQLIIDGEYQYGKSIGIYKEIE